MVLVVVTVVGVDAEVVEEGDPPHTSLTADVEVGPQLEGSQPVSTALTGGGGGGGPPHELDARPPLPLEPPLPPEELLLS